MVTGSKTRILGTGNFLYTVSFYDDKARVIQVQSQNISGGTDVSSTQYGWQGLPLLTITRHQKSGSNSQTSIVLTKLNYDSLSRVVKTEKKVSNTKVSSGAMPGSWTTVNEQEYDALGQLQVKELGADPVETLTYDYNIRGWMLGANRDYAKHTSSTSNYFGFDLGYDKTTVQATGQGSIGSYAASQYNGNITGMVWKSTGDDEIRKYDFTYDAANRLLSGDFNQYTGGSFNRNANIDFSLSNMSYDANGNIISMKHRGLKLGTSHTIDSLKYHYIANSNRLLNVIDGVNDAQTKLGDFRTSTLHPSSGSKSSSTTDYSYDVNGNLVKDLNKDIVTYAGGNGIVYNHLNLPQTITVRGASGNKGTIEYTYDAMGNKLKKVTTEGSTVTSTLYMFGNYVNDTLQFLPHEEGRVRFKKEDNTLHYDYMLKDHLGNVRMLLTAEKDTSYYPEVTHEDATISNEDIYYENVDVGLTARPGSFYSSGTNGSKVQLLRQSTDKIGTGKLLKVMAKDRLHIKVDYYTPTETTDNSGADGLNSLLSALSALINNSSFTGGFHGNGSTVTNTLNSSTPFTDFLAPQSGSGGTMPKAYLNIVFFDEQFKFVEQNSEIVQVSTKGSGQTITRITTSAKEAVKNGYVYVYVSNESNNLVYFDNFQVTHERGPILEETHYYPFGLTMAGISSKALNGVAENKQKFNGIEQNNDFDLNMYDAFYRNLDPQIGRFWQIDPKPNEMYSSYSALQNSPIRYFDPLGDTVGVDKTSLTAEYQQNGQTVTGAQLGQQMVDDWAAASGLNLSLDTETGMITETGVTKGKGYSKSARKLVRKMLGKGVNITIGFSQTEGSEGKDNSIRLGVDEIQGFINNTPKGIASNTLGYGMTAFHEWFHTTPGGSFEHTFVDLPTSYSQLLDKPDIEVNKIRAELTIATGVNYGQRGAYTGVWWWDNNGKNGKDYLPLGTLTPQQYQQIKNASRNKDASLLPNVPFLIRPLPDNKYMMRN